MKYPLLSSNQVLVVSAIAFTFMLGAVLGVPWLFTDPYDDRFGDSRGYYVIVVSEIDGSETESVETIADLKNNSAKVSSEELSSHGQELIDIVLDNGTSSSYRGVNATRHELRFCDDAIPVCDEFGPHPDEFGHRTVVDTDAGQYVVIEHPRSQYRPSQGVSGMIVLFAMLPTAGLLAHQALFARERQPRIVVGVAAYGTLLTIGGIADPFLYMFYDISLRQYSSALVGFTWLLIVGVAVAHRQNRSTKRDQTEVSDQ